MSSLYKFEPRVTNSKGDDDFATKMTSIKKVEGEKSFGLNKKCEK